MGDDRRDARSDADVADSSFGIDRDATAERVEPATDAATDRGAVFDVVGDSGRSGDSGQAPEGGMADGSPTTDVVLAPDSPIAKDAWADEGKAGDSGGRDDASDASNGGRDGSKIDVTDAGSTDNQDAADAPIKDVRDACVVNPCGGCTVLTNSPGTSCGACGTYACNGTDAVTCNDPGTNACGGCAILTGAPGASCGSCGTYACNGTNVVTCNDPGLNACGGCGVLTGTPGASCGTCGQYVCATDKASVVCDHPDPLKVTQLAAGYFHTCALLSNGAVRCWGYNANGQLGDGSTVTRLIPTGDVLAGAVAIGAGWGHSCAIMASGGLRCWGYNGNGELGDGLGGDGTADHDRHTPPSSDIGGLSAVTQVSLGVDQSCVISSGNAYCWGANYAGQLGDMAPSRNAPGAAFLGGVSAIGAGQSVTCAISGGNAGCWGQKADEFQLAALNGSTYIMPPRGGYGCAIDATGYVRCFYGSEITVQPLINVSSLGVGHSHVCSVSGGDVRCWGKNNWGQIGEPSSTTPERMSPDGPIVVAGATAVVAGNDHTCALLASGGVRCWGIVYTSTSVESPPSDVTGFCP